MKILLGDSKAEKAGEIAGYIVCACLSFIAARSGYSLIETALGAPVVGLLVYQVVASVGSLLIGNKD